jgi:hypothetical protein
MLSKCLANVVLEALATFDILPLEEKPSTVHLSIEHLTSHEPNPYLCYIIVLLQSGHCVALGDQGELLQDSFSDFKGSGTRRQRKVI